MHAYVLITNHVHLLMTPTAAGQITRVMQSLGQRYVRYVNDRDRPPHRNPVGRPLQIITG